MADHETDRNAEIKAIHREYRFFYQILGGAILVGIGILIGALWFSSDLDRSAYVVNLYTSILSIIVTVFVIDLLNRRRDERNALRQLQEQLIRDAGSTSNEIAKNAIHQLRKRHWLEGDGGLLRKANLLGANLSGAEITDMRYVGANLREANLSRAALQQANLPNANLQDANLSGANLQEANLHGANLQRTALGANLQGASLNSANLQKANLGGAKLSGTDARHANFNKVSLLWADLRGANLFNANLTDAYLFSTEFDESTILPDGTHWTPDTDMTQFGCIVSDE